MILPEINVKTWADLSAKQRLKEIADKLASIASLRVICHGKGETPAI